MTDGERFKRDGASSEEALARTLSELGPLLRRRAEVGAPDPAFVRRLRTRLLSAEQLSPHPAVRPGRRAQPMTGQGPKAGAATRTRPRVVALAGPVAALVAAALILALILPRAAPHPGGPDVAWHLPYPSPADLGRGYPAAAAPAGPLPLAVSLAATPAAPPYPGRLSLSAPALPPTPRVLEAFRLTNPLSIVARIGELARLLGIHARITHIGVAGTSWVVAATGGRPLTIPLHSLAISPLTGELVYHDTSAPPVGAVTPLLAGSHAVEAARSWLTRLGWPGRAMPLAGVEPLSSSATALQVRFGWGGPVASAVDAATVWVTPAGHVMAGHLWPPITQARLAPPTSIAGAWSAVRAGRIPPVIDDVLRGTRASGTGIVRRVTVTQVVAVGADHFLYLVPAYRFEGITRLQGLPRARAWYAVAAAIRGGTTG